MWIRILETSRNAVIYCHVPDILTFALFTTPLPFFLRVQYEIQSIRWQMETTTRTSSFGSEERYASLAYERLVRAVWEESGSGSAAARAVHETAKRMMIVRL